MDDVVNFNVNSEDANSSVDNLNVKQGELMATPSVKKKRKKRTILPKPEPVEEPMEIEEITVPLIVEVYIPPKYCPQCNRKLRKSKVKSADNKLYQMYRCKKCNLSKKIQFVM